MASTLINFPSSFVVVIATMPMTTTTPLLQWSSGGATDHAYGDPAPSGASRDRWRGAPGYLRGGFEPAGDVRSSRRGGGPGHAGARGGACDGWSGEQKRGVAHVG